VDAGLGPSTGAGASCGSHFRRGGSKGGPGRACSTASVYACLTLLAFLSLQQQRQMTRLPVMLIGTSIGTVQVGETLPGVTAWLRALRSAHVPCCVVSPMPAPLLKVGQAAVRPLDA
jgi:hypothetical protein